MGTAAFSRTFLWIPSWEALGATMTLPATFCRYAIATQSWRARVERLAKDEAGLPPVDLFQIGDAYFVNDGNHRCRSCVRWAIATIEAYVTPVHSRVPLSPEVQPKDLILKAELADFLDCTRIDFLRPVADITVTSPGAYADLLKHIECTIISWGLTKSAKSPGRKLSPLIRHCFFSCDRGYS